MAKKKAAAKKPAAPAKKPAAPAKKPAAPASKPAAQPAAKPPAPKREPLRMLVVESRFYIHLADMLLAGAQRVLQEAGAEFDRITVPGSLEIPPAIAMAVDAAQAAGKPYDGVVALGCVIAGETYHFEVVSNESARGLMDLALGRTLPIGNGILTVETELQARVRADPNEGDKGGEAARTAITMVALKRTLAGL
jgi:6,7-dimethyl-8-ribityllumazine synthase